MRLAVKDRTWGRDDRGVVAIVVVLLMVGLLTTTAIVVDMGDARQQNRQARAAADLGSLAGAQSLPCKSTGTPCPFQPAGCPDASCTAAFYTLSSVGLAPTDLTGFVAGRTATCNLDPFDLTVAPEKCSHYTNGKYTVEVTTPYDEGAGVDTSKVHVNVCWNTQAIFAGVIGVTSQHVCGGATAQNTGLGGTTTDGTSSGGTVDCSIVDNFAVDETHPTIFAFDGAAYPANGSSLDLTKAKAAKQGSVIAAIYTSPDTDIDLSKITVLAPTTTSGANGPVDPEPTIPAANPISGSGGPKTVSNKYTVQSLTMATRSGTDLQADPTNAPRQVSNKNGKNLPAGRGVKGTSTKGSTSITLTQGTLTSADLGAEVKGANLPANTHITAVNSATTATVSLSATKAGTNLGWTITDASATVSVGGAGFQAGDVGKSITGDYIASGTTITAVSPPAQATLSKPTTSGSTVATWAVNGGGGTTTTITSSSAKFSALDIGSTITIGGVANIIDDVVSATQAVVDTPISPTTAAAWSITSPTKLAPYAAGGTHAFVIAYQLPATLKKDTGAGTPKLVYDARIDLFDPDDITTQCGHASWTFTADGTAVATAGACGEDSFVAGVFPKKAQPGDEVGADYNDESALQMADYTEDPVYGINFQISGPSFNPNGDGTPYQIPKSATPGVYGSTDGYTLTDPPVHGHEAFNTRIAFKLPPADQLIDGVYTVYLKAYDTDQNKVGNDCGQAKWTFTLSGGIKLTK